MAIAIIAIVAVVAATAWTALDRNLGRAIAGSVGVAAVLAGLALAIAGDDFTATMLQVSAALAGAAIGIGMGFVLRGALAGGGERLMVADRATPAKSAKTGPSKKQAAEAAETRHKMQAAIRKQRDAADRLVAGNVQLLDLGKLLQPADGQPQLAKAEASEIARATANAMLAPADMMVPTGQEGLVFLFDGLDLAAAEAKSQEIADAITDALGATGKESPFIAKGFAHELDDYMEGAMIDSVEDLVRVVQLAHQAYVMKERGLAKELDRDLHLDARAVLRPDTLDVIGYEIQVYRVRGGERGSRRDILTFNKLKPPYGAEIDCAAVFKLTSAVRNLTLGREQALLLPIRFETLSHPLYLGNLMDALESLPKNLRDRLVCNVVIDRGSAPPRLEAVSKALKRLCKGVLIHPVLPYRDLAKAKSHGVEGLVLSASTFTENGGQDALSSLVTAAREAKLFVTLIGASGELTLVQKLNLPYSWTDA